MQTVGYTTMWTVTGLQKVEIPSKYIILICMCFDCDSLPQLSRIVLDYWVTSSAENPTIAA